MDHITSAAAAVIAGFLIASPAYAECDHDTQRLSELYKSTEGTAETITLTIGSTEYTDDTGAHGTGSSAVSERNGELYVPADILYNTFDIGRSEVSLYSADTDIAAFAEAYGLTVDRSGNTVTITDPYASGRIIISGNDIPAGHEAIALTEEMTLINCGDRATAYELCEQINSSGIGYAAPDVRLSLCETEENSYRWTDHLSWGSELVGTDIFSLRVLQKYGSMSELDAVTVAVIDSGIDYTHPFLEERIETEKGYDFYNSDDDAMDDHSHGTHVAGIICDNTLPNVKLIPFKITNAYGNASLSTLIGAINAAIDSDADIINMSLGSKDLNGVATQMLSPLFEKLEELQITAVTAAGNDAKDASIYTPANIESCITVSACGSSGVFASSYSDYGDVVDICAPGTLINSSVLNGQYNKKSGTSMACPFVSAAAAMLKTFDPTLTPGSITELLITSADDKGDEGFDECYGWGVLDMGALTTLYTSSDDTPVYIADADGSAVTIRLSEPVENQNGTIAAALYSDGILTHLFAAESTGDGEYALPVSIKDGDALKLFVYNDLSRLTPLCGVYSVQLRDTK